MKVTTPDWYLIVNPSMETAYKSLFLYFLLKLSDIKLKTIKEKDLNPCKPSLRDKEMVSIYNRCFPDTEIFSVHCPNSQ